MNPLHAKAWIAWLAAAIVALSLTRNPIYLLTLVICIALVGRALRGEIDAPPLPLPLWRLALMIILLSALINAATAHFGRTVLFTLPARLPLLGGPVTLEALVFGMINGLVLVGFLAAFTVLYQALPTQALIRMIPRALFPVAVVISIAVAFVPTTLAQFQQIREAQMMRGHRVAGLRDWLPLFMPLLVGGLERAFQLAEAMTARGFGNLGAAAAAQEDSPAESDRLRLALALGLAALLAGLLVLLFWQQQVVGWSLIALGGGGLLLALHRQGRRVARTTYRRQRWTWRDGLVALAAAITVAVYLLPASRATLAYTPYPQLAWPPVNLGVMLATLALLTPAALLAQARWRRARPFPAAAARSAGGEAA